MPSPLALRRGAEALASTSQPSARCRATKAPRARRRSPPLRPFPSSSHARASAEGEGDVEQEDDPLSLDCELEDLELDEGEDEVDRPPRARPAPKGSLSKPNGLAASAAAFAADVAAGVSPEDAAAAALGARDVSGLTEAQQRYADKVAAALAAKAEADARAKAARAARFEAGKFFYAKGRYPEAVKTLTEALDAEGPFTQLGGEISLWLALAHGATGDEASAIRVYKEVEASHPSPKMKRQAADLRYIMEAPKLRVGKDEKVALPEVEEATRSDKGGDRRRSPRPPPSARRGAAPTRPKTLEERWAEEYRPPNLVPNKYVAVAATAVAVAAAVISARVG